MAKKSAKEKKLSAKDLKEVNRLIGLLPEEITVSVRRSKDGGFVAEIKTYPGCFTEAETFSELSAMVSDAIYTHLDIPLKYLRYMPGYIPPVKLASKAMGFPLPEKKQLKLKLQDRDALVAREALKS